jgi:xanthine dehydrogenase YagR molybdenum-binding subunit
VPDVIFVPENDTAFNPTGAKTLGEIAVVGSSAAVANAVAHATGLRITGLPLTPDKLMI